MRQTGRRREGWREGKKRRGLNRDTGRDAKRGSYTAGEERETSEETKTGKERKSERDKERERDLMKSGRDREVKRGRRR